MVAVRIRMKKLGRKHRPFFRICAVDSRAPRDGRVLEELGTYDPMIAETDARAALNHERFSYWLGVGAQMSDKVRVLFRKYGPEGTHAAAREAAMANLSGPRVIPDLGSPAYVPTKESETSAEKAPDATAQEEVAETKGAATETDTPNTEAATAEQPVGAAEEGNDAGDATDEADKSE